MSERLTPRIIAFGEAALLVEFGTTPDLALNTRVHALARSLDAAPLPAQTNLVPGYVSLLVEFDPLTVDLDVVHLDLTTRLHTVATTSITDGRQRVLPTVYGGAFGPDLDFVAERTGLPSEEVVKQHASIEYRVYMLGFSPGYPYLGDLPPGLALRRRETPRERVPIGSVGIAGLQTGVYSREMPGGWHLLGRTPRPLFDASRDPPAYLAPGDRVRFVAIGSEDWDRYAHPADDW